jgi:hypothetical protein
MKDYLIILWSYLYIIALISLGKSFLFFFFFVKHGEQKPAISCLQVNYNEFYLSFKIINPFCCYHFLKYF